MTYSTESILDNLGQDAYTAELLDRAEKAEAQVGEANRRLERAETRLLIARLWVKELALWVDEAQGRSRGTALDSNSILAWRTRALVREREHKPLPVYRLLAVSGLVALPWAVLAVAAYVVWLATS